MAVPNRNTLWGQAIVGELVAAGVDAVVVSPGSRSTPLAIACARHEDLHVFSLLDERSAAYFALGRARRTGRVTPIVCTSGTAAANYHPAIMEADRGRVPMLALTADRPPELRDSGANQTADQEKLYGGAVRYYKDLPEPAAESRALRSVRTTIARAVAAAEGTNPGPVHLNVPFEKPLEPTPVPGDVPEDLDVEAEHGRDGAFVATHTGVPELSDPQLRKLAEALSAERGLIVAGPAGVTELDPEAVTALAHATGYPVIADPLSGLRFGGHTRAVPVIGGYDAYLSEELAGNSGIIGWTDPDVVVRLGAAPTSKRLRKYLAATDADQYVVDPAGDWREAEFRATDLVIADPSRLCGRLSRVVSSRGTDQWRRQWAAADDAAFDIARDALQEEPLWEGAAVATVADNLPDPATLFVSNSMPVRDLDRFAEPSTANVTALGNRGVSGVDGIISTALGAGSGTTDDLTLVIGDLAFYHDTNGLLALDRCDVDATIVVVNNDGGGIFHKLPIEGFEPEFTSQFKTPHGLEFESISDHYDTEYVRIDARDDAENAASVCETIAEAYTTSIETDGTHIIEIRTDAERSHRVREQLRSQVLARLELDPAA